MTFPVTTTIAASPPTTSRLVKLADLADNTDPNRLSRVAEPEQTQLRAKYRKADVSLGRDDLAQAL